MSTDLNLPGPESGFIATFGTGDPHTLFGHGFAGAIRDRAELEDLKAELPMPLRVVRLTVPLGEIEKRLRSEVTSGRREDLCEAAVWVAGSLGVGIEEVTVSNDRPIREVAAEILDWLDWGAFTVA